MLRLNMPKNIFFWLRCFMHMAIGGLCMRMSPLGNRPTAALRKDGPKGQRAQSLATILTEEVQSFFQHKWASTDVEPEHGGACVCRRASFIAAAKARHAAERTKKSPQECAAMMARIAQNWGHEQRTYSAKDHPKLVTGLLTDASAYLDLRSDGKMYISGPEYGKKPINSLLAEGTPELVKSSWYLEEINGVGVVLDGRMKTFQADLRLIDLMDSLPTNDNQCFKADNRVEKTRKFVEEMMSVAIESSSGEASSEQKVDRQSSDGEVGDELAFANLFDTFQRDGDSFVQVKSNRARLVNRKFGLRLTEGYPYMLQIVPPLLSEEDWLDINWNTHSLRLQNVVKNAKIRPLVENERWEIVIQRPLNINADVELPTGLSIVKIDGKPITVNSFDGIRQLLAKAKRHSRTISMTPALSPLIHALCSAHGGITEIVFGKSDQKGMATGIATAENVFHYLSTPRSQLDDIVLNFGKFLGEQRDEESESRVMSFQRVHFKSEEEQRVDRQLKRFDADAKAIVDLKSKTLRHLATIEKHRTGTHRLNGNFHDAQKVERIQPLVSQDRVAIYGDFVTTFGFLPTKTKCSKEDKKELAETLANVAEPLTCPFCLAEARDEQHSPTLQSLAIGSQRKADFVHMLLSEMVNARNNKRSNFYFALNGDGFEVRSSDAAKSFTKKFLTLAMFGLVQDIKYEVRFEAAGGLGFGQGSFFSWQNYLQTSADRNDYGFNSKSILLAHLAKDRSGNVKTPFTFSKPLTYEQNTFNKGDTIHKIGTYQRGKKHKFLDVTSSRWNDDVVQNFLANDWFWIEVRRHSKVPAYTRIVLEPHCSNSDKIETDEEKTGDEGFRDYSFICKSYARAQVFYHEYSQGISSFSSSKRLNPVAEHRPMDHKTPEEEPAQPAPASSAACVIL